MTRIKFLLATSAMLMGATQAVAGTNLLTNGSFEDGFNGWSVNTTGSGTGFTAPVVIEYGQASGYPTGAFGEAVPADNAPFNPGLDPVGTHGAYFSSDVGLQTLSQTVSLVAGKKYTFGFDYYLPQNGYNNPNNATFSATLAGDPFASFTLGSKSPVTWRLVSATKTFVASTSGDFTFAFAGTAYPAKDVVIDRVFLAVPEPAAWAMMIGGFGVVGFAARRRRSVAVTA